MKKDTIPRSLIILGIIFIASIGFNTNSPILILISVSIISLFIVIKSSDYLVTSISHYGLVTGLPNYLMGLFILAIGTSLPDLSTGIIASIANHGSIIIGDVFGASILAMTILLGSIILFSKSIKIDEGIKNTTLWIPMLVTLPIILAFDGILSKIDGVLLLIAFIGYIFFSIQESTGKKTIKKDVKIQDIWKDMAIFLGTLVTLLLGTRWLIFSTIYIAKEMNVSLFIISLIFISFGTTVPELSVSIKSAKKNEAKLALGNILGSMAINSTFILGFASLINPIIIESQHTFLVSSFFVIALTLIGTFIINRKKISKNYAYLLFALYAVFLLSQIL